LLSFLYRIFLPTLRFLASMQSILILLYQLMGTLGILLVHLRLW